MLTRSLSYTQTDICEILVQNLKPWSNVSTNQIKLTKLTGLTNVTYRAEIIEPSIASAVKPAIVIFRQFGEAEGFIDKDIERFVFQEIGKMDLGPLEYASGQNWRIEEFVMDGEHPDSHHQIDPKFQFNLMEVVQQFHCLNIPLPNMKTSNLVDKMFSEELKINVLNKISMEHLFEEDEISILQEIKDIVESEEQQNLLKSFVQAESQDVFEDKLVFSHNDLNQLNIFLTPKKGREVVLIDFEYCSYNYQTYDIANFLNESQINYKYPEEPYYKQVDENVCQPTELNFIVLCYTLFQILSENEILLVKSLITQFPEVTTNKEQMKEFQSQVEDIVSKHYKSEMPIKELRQKIKFLKKRVRRFMILSNYNWILWCILQSKRPGMDFDYIRYGKFRLNMMADQLKTELRKMQKIGKNEAAKNSCDEEDDQRTTSSDSDQQD